MVGPLPKDGLEPVEYASSSERRRLRPSRPSCGCGGDGAVDLRARGERDGLLRGAGGRIENGLAAPGCAGDADVVDKMGDLGHGLASFIVAGSVLLRVRAAVRSVVEVVCDRAQHSGSGARQTRRPHIASPPSGAASRTFIAGRADGSGT